MNELNQFIRFAGMKRNGNHAILNWLLNQYTGKVTFRNNAGKIENMINTSCDSIEAFDSPELVKTDLEEQCNKQLFLVTYEDFPVEKVFAAELDSRYEKWVKHKIKEVYKVVLLRDPLNYFASRLQGEINGDFIHDLKISTGEMEKLMARWKQYARCFITFKNSENPQEIAISYNDWLTSRTYRDSICTQLGHSNKNDECRRTISGWGGGSSFSGTTYEDQNSYLNRWTKFRDHPLFLELINDDEILAFTARIFGNTIDFKALKELF